MPEAIMAGKLSILECLISFPQDWRVNWDYPTGSHLLMILHQCALTDAGKTWITDINVKSQEKVHLMMDPPRLQIQLTNVLRQELQDPILILLRVQLE